MAAGHPPSILASIFLLRMAAIVNPFSLSSLVFVIISLASICLSDAQKGGFSVELIHRDSPKFPLYNHSETTYDRVINALRRSFSRASRFKPTSNSIDAVETDIITDSGEYLMKISIGTPAFDIVAITDTGSDLLSTQCKPCSLCNEQDAPVFDPSYSSTYEPVSCSASQCQNLEGSSCIGNSTCQYSVSCSSNNTCQYSIIGDYSFSNGDLATDTLTIPSTTGSPIVLPKVIFGCEHDNDDYFEEDASGVIGLGGGNFSLISQMGDKIAGKFSYCLLPPTKTGKSSKINFGSNAIVSGNGVVSTPLTKKLDSSSFYYLTLEAIGVGSTRIKFTGSAFGSNDGNIIIDSGIPFTLVPEDFYTALELAVSSEINAEKYDNPEGLLCYYTSGHFAIPEITMHFTNADVKLQHLNTFVAVVDNVACFTFIPFLDMAVYGNLAQTNFLVGYDTEKQTVSFKPTDCSSASASRVHNWVMPGSYLISVVQTLQIVACIMMIL